MNSVISVSDEMLKKLNGKELDLFFLLVKKMVSNDDISNGINVFDADSTLKQESIVKNKKYKPKLHYDDSNFNPSSNSSPGLVRINSQYSIIVNEELIKAERDGYYSQAIFSIWDTDNDIVYANFVSTPQEEFVFDEVKNLALHCKVKEYGKAYSLEEFENKVFAEYIY